MDGRRFDDLTRWLAGGTSRRRVLRGLAGGAVGGAMAAAGALRLAPHVAADGGCVGAGGGCGSDSDCCEGFCSAANVCYCEDPARPFIGCSCTTGVQNPCGDSTAVCCGTSDVPGGPGICVSASVGCAEPCAAPAEPCTTDAECCVGICGDEGFCYCEDPARPALGCPCDTQVANGCGNVNLVCCQVEGQAVGVGVCTSAAVGCDGQCVFAGNFCTGDDDCCVGQCSDNNICYCEDPNLPGVGCPCTTGTQNPCGDAALVCCPETDVLGGPGVCTLASVGCEQTAAVAVSAAGDVAVSVLPSTGSGDRGGSADRGWLGPMAAVGAGAALFIRRLRRAPASEAE